MCLITGVSLVPEPLNDYLLFSLFAGVFVVALLVYENLTLQTSVDLRNANVSFSVRELLPDFFEKDLSHLMRIQ